jgi:TetR/AcrR family transcriptional regulator, cholesterol catabolism regulator
MKTEERIIAASVELFYRNGIKSITMDDIASHLGISKKTIYQFYPDKDSIVMAITELELNEQLKMMDEMRSASANAVDEIFKVMSCITGTFSRITSNLFYDMQKYHPASWLRFHDFKEKNMRSFVEENLRAGIRQELYRSDINVKLMAKFRIEEVSMVFNPAIFPPDKYSIKEVQLVLLDHFVHGITTLRGHKLINKYKQVVEED